MLTKKDYKALAHIISKHSVEGEVTVEVILRKYFLNDLCILLIKDNSNFDEDKFREACKEE